MEKGLKETRKCRLCMFCSVQLTGVIHPPWSLTATACRKGLGSSGPAHSPPTMALPPTTLLVSGTAAGGRADCEELSSLASGGAHLRGSTWPGRAFLSGTSPHRSLQSLSSSFPGTPSWPSSFQSLRTSVICQEQRNPKKC